jgi:hypothetical protein
VIMTENYAHNDGNIAYKFTGLSIEILHLVCQKMNLTTVFLPPSLNMEIASYAKETAELDKCLSDVLTRVLPQLPIFLTSSFDDTIHYKIPYTHDDVKMLVPCPKAIPGTEKILTTFSLSVWLTMGLVLLRTTAVFWCAGNVPYRYVCNETHTYQSLSYCFHNAWAVFMGVSVPQQPTTSILRVFFFLYVCFVSLLSLYSKHSLFLIWWNPSMKRS